MGKSYPTAILQIRTGSTRLPGKMLMPFHNNCSIPELIIERIKTVLPAANILVATTLSKKDDPIEELALKLGVKCFRGDENDVLKRFLDAMEHFDLHNVMRICADNPFLSAEYLQTLITEFQNSEYDYISFEFPDGTPIMRSHIGLFAEIMRADFLKKIASSTQEALYREHVTNYVYEHKALFKTLFLPVPLPFANRQDIRLTIDTAGDFNAAQNLFSTLFNRNPDFSADDLLQAIDSNHALLQSMKTQIALNSK